jgi:hypothetical protein
LFERRQRAARAFESRVVSSRMHQDRGLRAGRRSIREAQA